MPDDDDQPQDVTCTGGLTIPWGAGQAGGE
jgi:hypothetical protein